MLTGVKSSEAFEISYLVCFRRYRHLDNLGCSQEPAKQFQRDNHLDILRGCHRRCTHHSHMYLRTIIML